MSFEEAILHREAQVRLANFWPHVGLPKSHSIWLGSTSTDWKLTKTQTT
jgi:hypothetical protein